MLNCKESVEVFYYHQPVVHQGMNPDYLITNKLQR
jgi:hypothetical protein